MKKEPETKHACDEDENLIQQCIDIIRSEQKASVSLLQRRLRLGYTRATRIMDELESRGVVGPSKGAEPRDIMPIRSPETGNRMLPAKTARAEFLAGNPEAAKLQKAHLKEFAKRFSKWADGLKPLVHTFVDKAEQARQIGIVLIEFTDTLPGKKLTRDFYEQLKAEFKNSAGKTIAFEELEWFIKVARSNAEPIKDFQTALQWRQPALIEVGEFQLESSRGPQERHLPPEPLNQIKDLFGTVTKIVETFRSDERYYVGGRIRDDLKDALRAELEPKKRALDEFWAELE